MNSEPWRDPLQELWQRQPVPPVAPRAEERILRAVQNVEEEWERETKASDRAIVSATLLVLLPRLAESWFNPGDFSPGEWLLYVSMASLMLGTKLVQRRRRHYERDFSPTLLGRIERLRAVAHLRLKWNQVNLAAIPVLPVVVSLLLYDWTGGSLPAAIVAGVVALGLFGWLCRLFWREQRARFLARLAELDAMQAELAKV